MKAKNKLYTCIKCLEQLKLENLDLSTLKRIQTIIETMEG